MPKHRRHHGLCAMSQRRANFSVHASLAPTPSVEGPGWWLITEESSPNVFTPATELFPDGLWNDGQTVLPGDDAFTLDAVWAELDSLQNEHGRCFAANFQWPPA